MFMLAPLLPGITSLRDDLALLKYRMSGVTLIAKWIGSFSNRF